MSQRRTVVMKKVNHTQTLTATKNRRPPTQACPKYKLVKNAVQGRGNVCEGKKQSKKEKQKPLTTFDIFEVILKINIKTVTELQAYAHAQRVEGKKFSSVHLV